MPFAAQPTAGGPRLERASQGRELERPIPPSQIMRSASDRLEEALAAVDQHAQRTNAFIYVDANGARAAARAVDQERKNGVDRGPLHGMPISIKDLIDIAGRPTTAASNVRRDHIAAEDAPVIRRLREAGAVIIGKTNLHEFAL